MLWDWLVRVQQVGCCSAIAAIGSGRSYFTGCARHALIACTESSVTYTACAKKALVRQQQERANATVCQFRSFMESFMDGTQMKQCKIPVLPFYTANACFLTPMLAQTF